FERAANMRQILAEEGLGDDAGEPLRAEDDARYVARDGPEAGGRTEIEEGDALGPRAGASHTLRQPETAAEVGRARQRRAFEQRRRRVAVAPARDAIGDAGELGRGVEIDEKASAADEEIGALDGAAGEAQHNVAIAARRAPHRAAEMRGEAGM